MGDGYERRGAHSGAISREFVAAYQRRPGQHHLTPQNPRPRLEPRRQHPARAHRHRRTHPRGRRRHRLPPGRADGRHQPLRLVGRHQGQNPRRRYPRLHPAVFDRLARIRCFLLPWPGGPVRRAGLLHSFIARPITPTHPEAAQVSIGLTALSKPFHQHQSALLLINLRKHESLAIMRNAEPTFHGLQTPVEKYFSLFTPGTEIDG